MAKPPFRVERDDGSAAFFDAAIEGRLLLRRCVACGRLYPPYQLRCIDGDAFSWHPASGRAVLVTWAADHGQQLTPELARPGDGSAVLGIVELEEGPWMSVALTAIASDELREGMPMMVRFVPVGGGEPVVVFSPNVSANGGSQ